MDFYKILGVPETASQEEIKKSYRKLAGLHHPDKGGDTSTFQTISQAYDTLSDVNKRAQYDAQRSGDKFHFTSSNMNDIFDMFATGHHFNHAFRQQRSQQARRKNRDLNIKVTISLKQSYTGADLEATYQSPGGYKKSVVIKIPEGIQSGQTIKYQGLGDDDDPSLPPGDLNATIIVAQTQQYARRGDDLIVYTLVHPIEAMIGCTKSIDHLNGSQLNISIRPGVQHGTEYLTKGLGFSNLKGNKGNLITIVCIEVPAVTDLILKEKLEQIYAEISLSQQ